MSFSTLFKALAVAALIKLSVAGYALEDDYNTQNFFSEFAFFTDPDPTHGFVNFVDQGTAQSDGLISTSGGSVKMGVDHQNIAPNGRNSVRITSNKVYNEGLIILDLAHMPEGCGTWPAFWMTGPSWPYNGEIDIIEGVNDQSFNAMTLHTGPGCSITNNNQRFSGVLSTSNCDVNDPSQAKNAGCSIDASYSSSNTFGSGLNSINGGVYATEWTSSGISTYFFPRSSIPSDITSGKPNPSSWGRPLSSFSGSCDLTSSFKNQQIVFDTTFCGDWAGDAWWSSSTCRAKASSCNDYVANNPSAFADAYWDINSLKVYKSDGSSDDDSSPYDLTASAAYPTSVPVTFATSAQPTGYDYQSYASSAQPTDYGYQSLTSIGAWGKAAYAAAPTTTPGVVPAAATQEAAAAISYAPPPGGWGSIDWNSIDYNRKRNTKGEEVAPAIDERNETAVQEEIRAEVQKQKEQKKRMHSRHIMKHARGLGKKGGLGI